MDNKVESRLYIPLVIYCLEVTSGAVVVSANDVVVAK